MIITLIAVALIIVGIIGYIVFFKLWSDCGFFISVISIILGAIVLLTSLCFIGKAQINKDIKYENKLYEREVLVYRIENEDAHTTGNELLYRDIVDFNNGLRATKKWANNPWTSWFFNEDIATIDYIEID